MRNRYRIRRLPILKPEYDSTARPYGLWDIASSCYVDKYGRPDPSHEYWCLTREVAVMRRHDLNEYEKDAIRRMLS